MSDVIVIPNDKAAAWERMQAIWAETLGAEPRVPMNAAQEREYDALADLIQRVDDEAQAQQRHDAIARIAGERAERAHSRSAQRATAAILAGGPVDRGDATAAYDRAVERYIRYGMGALEVEERQVLRSGYRAEQRAQSSAPGSAGGYLVPTGFGDRIFEIMKLYGGMRQVADVLPTNSGEDLPYPTVDDTGNTGELIGENTAVASQDVAFGQKTLRAYIYSSKMVKVPLALLQDETIGLEALLGRLLGIRLGRIQNTHFTTGDGSAKPYGVINAATVGKTTAGAAAITYNEMVDLEHSVDAAYRQRGNVRYMFHDSVFQYLRKIVDGSSRPIWLPNTAAPGIPASLNGYPYTINNDMASSVATTNKTVAFGDFSAYMIRDVQGITLLRLDERYADSLQVAFLAFARADGNLMDTSALKVMQQA